MHKVFGVAARMRMACGFCQGPLWGIRRLVQSPNSRCLGPFWVGWVAHQLRSGELAPEGCVMCGRLVLLQLPAWC